MSSRRFFSRNKNPKKLPRGISALPCFHGGDESNNPFRPGSGPETMVREATMNKRRFFICLLFLLFSGFFSPRPLLSAECGGLSVGQTIYVPAYSHIYSGNNERPFLLTVTLSIRNIDPKHEITITEVDYYETQGKRLRVYLNQPKI
jgi:hypothetical protein